MPGAVVNMDKRITSPNPALVLPYALLVSLFLVELVFDRFLSEGGTARIHLMLIALSRFAVLGALALLSLGPAIFRNSPARFKVPGKNTAVMSALFLVLVLFSGLVGFVRGNSFSYVIGDMFKFAVFPIMIIVVYASIRSSGSFHRLLFATVFVYTLYLFGIMLMYFSVWMKNQRLVSVYIYPFMPFIIYYLRGRAKGSRMSYWLGVLLIFYVLCFPFLVWFSQSLSLVLEVGFLGVVTWFLHHHRGSNIKAAFLGTAFLAVILVLFLMFDTMALFSLFDKITGNGSYLTSKLYFLKLYGLSIKGLVLLGGDRLSNLFVVAGSFYRNPLKFIIGGQGMGSEIKITSLAGVERASKLPEIHFIESAFPEVLYRMGAIGLVLYISIFIALLKRALKWRKENLFCAFSAAYAVYILIFSIINMGFVGEGFGSLYMVSMVYAGVFLLDREFRNAGLAPNKDIAQ